MKKIGIIGVYKEDENGSFTRLYDDYVEAIESRGDMVVHIIPANTKNIEYFVGEMDGFILPGGDDVSPCTYGKEKSGTKTCYAHNDVRVLEFMDKIIKSKKPLLGVCRGMQLINIYFGGTLIQDIPENILHDQGKKGREYIHSVSLTKNSKLQEIFGIENLEVNSIHHQAIDNLGEGIQSVAVSDDNYIEAIEHTQHKQILGVQWHPELLIEHHIIFQRFFEDC